MTHHQPLSPAELYLKCDPDQFQFETTAEITELDHTLGQQRAFDSLKFGANIKREGYNLFVSGPRGAGKKTFVEKILQKIEKKPAPACDWCYVHNFAQANKPLAIKLPKTLGKKFRADLHGLIETLLNSIPAAFESEVYQSQLNEIEEEFSKKRDAAMATLRKQAQEEDIDLIRTPKGFAFVPLKNNKVIDAVAYDQLPEKEQKRVEKAIHRLQDQLAAILQQIPRWQQDGRKKIKALNAQVTLLAVGYLIDELKTDYHQYADALVFLQAVQDDIVENVETFRGFSEVLSSTRIAEEPFLRRYLVNLIVDNSDTNATPMVYEGNPTLDKLIGKVEHLSQMGTLVTDFTLIKAGALHQANGGYLIIDAQKVLTNPLAWDALKRCLSSRTIRIESLAQSLGLIHTVSLEPEPIPADLKVILLGDRTLYYLLCEYDPEFPQLFKVTADFEDIVDRSSENMHLYARLIASIAKKENLKPFDKTAIARIIELGSRVMEDNQKISTHIGDITNIIHESEYWAEEENHSYVTARDVQKAIDQKVYRSNRIQTRLQESMERGITLIDTTGEKVGQVNALTVIAMGDYMFGQPSRVTATARAGEGKVIDIEHEADLGGELHTKGMLILSHFLSARYARKKPLSLIASVVLEQSYGEIDGDSASVAELCAILSSIADVPIKQNLAITGSINQLGEVQAIGGVNEKVEGFFDICNARELTGTQGVIIPQSNICHLMLKQNVVNAATHNLFFIYPVATIDQALELLTGMEAGERDEQGNFPENSLNAKIETALLEMAEIAQGSHEHGGDEPAADKTIGTAPDDENPPEPTTGLAIR